jgi:aminoglycoside 3-N-acetyltransferase
MSITTTTLANDFHAIGFRSGDRVVVHSSLRGIGYVEGGAKTVVQALLDVVGPDGLIVAPTFTYVTDLFDPMRSAGVTGTIPETIRSWPGAVRSWHPTHAVTALGADAAEVCAGHHLMGGLAVGSPLDRVADAGGYVLLLGVGHIANSTVHVGESHAKLPFLDVPFGPDYPHESKISVDGQEMTVPLLFPPGCSRAFGLIEQPLRERGAIRDGKIGNALSQVMRGRDVIAAVVDLVGRNPGALLCTDPTCYRCTESKRRLETAAG